MTAPASRETARVTTFVAVHPDDAFDVFTSEIDRWWRRGPRFRHSRRMEGELAFDGGAGGRLVERTAGGEVFVIGRVLAWEPGARLVFEWRASNYAPGEWTEVEVRFQAARGGTRVVLEHRGWEALRRDHPARHGQQDAVFSQRIGLWWADLLTAYRTFAPGAVSPR